MPDSYDEWLEALNSGIMGRFQTIKGADGETEKYHQHRS